MKQYQTIIGLGLVAISILVAAFVLQYQGTSPSVSTDGLHELDDDEKSKVETDAVFKSFVVNSITQYKATPKETRELYKDRREEDNLTLDIYNGNTNTYIKSIDLKITIRPSQKIKKQANLSFAKSRTYRVEVDCAPLSCRTVYVKCMSVPEPLTCDHYTVNVVSMKGKTISAAKE